jgi:beta-lactam-binding protein with PASTA domain
VMGTATYFSPEQAQGLAVDGRSDVYSLGVVLYEMITGVAPFTGDSPVAVAYKHVREAPVPPTRRNPEVPPDLEQIVLTAMAKEPDLRYQSADDMRADLLRFRRGRPLAAAPVTALIAEEQAGATMLNPSVAAAYAGNMASTTTGTLAPARSRPRRFLIAIATFLVLALLATAVYALSQAAGNNQGKTKVPDVRNLTLTAAQAQLEDKGFTVKPTYRTSTTVTKNVVINQNPSPDTLLKKGGTVQLFVSNGAGDVTVPNVQGANIVDAKKAIEAAGLKVSQKNQPSETITGFLVITTNPKGGEEVARGSTVTVVVSTGPPQVAVPNVLNLDAAAAAAQIGGAGFSFVQHNTPDNAVPVGKVIRTDPMPNTMAAKGSAVNVYVSSGPQQVAVPTVEGLKQADAETQITAAGLVPSVVFTPSTPGNAGKVIDQSPAPNTQVDTGSTVVLTVGEFDASTTTTTGGGPSTTTTTTH